MFISNPMLSRLGIVTVLGLASFASHADINFNGFASIRATALDSDTGLSPFETLKGDGDISFKDESLFALQARTDLGEKLSATVQLLAEGSEDFDVDAKWAYLSYEVNDSHNLIVGRFAIPLFNQSQYQDVGFAHNYGRLPKAVYADLDFNTMEGVSLDSTYFVGDLVLETKLVYGAWDDDDASFKLNDLMGINAGLSGDWWKVFAGYLVADFESTGLDNQIVGGLQGGIDIALALGASQQDANALLAASTTDGKDGYYWFIGADIDYENFMFDAEIVEYSADDTALPVTTAQYFSVGYRFDDIVLTVHTEESEDELDYGFLNRINHPVLVATGQGLHQALATPKRDGVGVTMRYDFHPSAALKIDFFTGEDDNPAVGDFDIWSVGVDMVF